MSLGIKNVKFAKVTPEGTVITGINGINQSADDATGIFTADQDTSYGVASVALSGLTGTVTPVWGSDVITYQSSGKGTPSSVLTINALPNAVKMAILGNKPDGKGGYTISGKADSKNLIAFLVESRETFADDKPVYIGMYMGIASEAAHTFTSSNATDNRTTDVITIAGQERGDEGFGKHWFSESANFVAKDMLNDIFKPAVTTP